MTKAKFPITISVPAVFADWYVIGADDDEVVVISKGKRIWRLRFDTQAAFTMFVREARYTANNRHIEEGMARSALSTMRRIEALEW